MSVSLVARQHGVAPNQVFKWRQLYAEGALSAVGAGEEVVAASEYRALQHQVRELQRLLGKKTLENEILSEALDLAQPKNGCCARPRPFGTQSLYGWLGVGTEGVDMSGFAQPEHVTPNAIRASIWGGVPRRLWQSPVFRGVRQHVPRSIEAMLRGLTTRDRCRRLVDITSVAEFLRPTQLQQTEELIRLIGRDFPEWTTLNKNKASPSGMRTIARQNGIGHSV